MSPIARFNYTAKGIVKPYNPPFAEESSDFCITRNSRAQLVVLLLLHTKLILSAPELELAQTVVNTRFYERLRRHGEIFHTLLTQI